ISVSLAVLISVIAGAISYRRFMGNVKAAEEYVSKALESRIPEAEIRQKLIDSGWEPEIVESMIKMELKIAEEKQLNADAEQGEKEGEGKGI
ncbi:MAG: hypothetical protein NT001_01285, partial [Candidatus Woesearchaeota archaeon]|nr:hypothetical protein [Candidatus Woesearchaeota archaeon]